MAVLLARFMRAQVAGMVARFPCVGKGRTVYRSARGSGQQRQPYRPRIFESRMPQQHLS